MTNRADVTETGGGAPPTPAGLRPAAKEVARKTAKAAFAAADLFLGQWPGPRILIYHQIGAGSGRQMDLSAEMFRGHVKWLLDHGRIVGLGDALSGADDPESSRRFVLTFDDGYADFYEDAFPMLRDQGIPFTLYLTSGHIETGALLHPGDRPLSWDQVEEMLESGLVTLGAHTHTHPDLRGLPRDQMEHEIGESNRLIELRTGQFPMHFAYPKGYWDPTAEAVVRAVYMSAVLGAGEPVSQDTNPFRIARVPVQRADGHFFFKRKVARGMRMEERVRSLVKGYQNPSGNQEGKRGYE
jgi:peptidoglycan/xylan/chitin deacetylase (PgdA/CDA1 family)